MMMELSLPQFVGTPCSLHGSYTFYKAFRYFKHGKHKVITIGNFFFVRISAKEDPCIGELQLLWLDRNTNQKLATVRLYFLPEQTPDGRLASHGQDEMLAASDKVVLRLDDLVEWITDQVDWTHGILATCADDVTVPPDILPIVESPPSPPSTPVTLSTTTVKDHPPSEDKDHTQANNQKQRPNNENSDSQCKETQNSLEDEKRGKESVVLETKESSKENPSPEAVTVNDTTEQTIVPGTENGDSKQLIKENDIMAKCDFDKDQSEVLVLPYSNYCRFRAIIKRLEGFSEQWLMNALVVALGGFTLPGKNTHILFCRETFDHEELAQHDLNYEYLAPTLKMKKQKKKGKNVRSTSPGSESNTSEESKEITYKNDVNKSNNGFKQPPCKTEQEFLQKLFKFMKKRSTPIQRVPHLGFKQIDLFVFFSFAQKLGGYDKITGKKLWKHVYDELGGNPGSTSAATCTRRHYERLLLPFERFMDGRVYKPKQSRKSSKIQNKKMTKDENANETPEEAKMKISSGTEIEDAYTFTDSNHENSKDSIANEDIQSLCEEQILSNDAYSDEDSKTIWSIQHKPDSKDDNDKEENKQIKPLIIQKEQSESFSEKERKWNEIRRKNALARKWVRQLRPSRGCRLPGTEKTQLVQEEQSSVKFENQLDVPALSFKEELQTSQVDTKPQILDANSPVSIKPYEIQEMLDQTKTAKTDPNITKYLHEKYKSSPLKYDTTANLGHDFSTGKKNISLKTSDSSFSLDSSVKFPQLVTVKIEPLSAESKSWCGYSRDAPNQKTSHLVTGKYLYDSGFEMNPVTSFIKQEIKPAIKNECDLSRELLLQTVSQQSSDSSIFNNTVKSEVSNIEDKPNISQRRPSVIQHTEYVTSPSPSQSPKQTSSETFSDVISREGIQALPSFSSNSKGNLFSNHLSFNMAGKVTEWLTKRVPEAVACKTPSALTEKAVELHDKVLMPSSCKTPGPGTGKVPMYVNKHKSDPYGFSLSSSKSVRENLLDFYKHRSGEPVKRSAGSLPHGEVRNTPMNQKPFPPISTASNSGSLYARTVTKYDQTFSLPDRSKQYNEPLYNQVKRHRTITVPLPASAPRPSLLPFVRQQMYRTSPLSDIPKTTLSSCAGYENTVLDLSVKKRPSQPINPVKCAAPANIAGSGQSVDDAVCLDLSIKKKPSSNLSGDNGIENITPPLPSSPNPSPLRTSFPLSSSKPLPNFVALHDISMEETLRQKVSHSSRPTNTVVGPQTSLPISPLVMSSGSGVFPGSAHGKIPPNFIASFTDAFYTKEMAKSLYMPPDRHSQFPPFVIPPFYPANWTPTNASSSVNQSSSSSPNNSHKGAVNHGVFPKQYMYNYKQQFHPVLCKDNGHYPSNSK